MKTNIKKSKWIVAVITITFLSNLSIALPADRYIEILQNKDRDERHLALQSLEEDLSKAHNIVGCHGMGDGRYDALKITFADGTSGIFKTDDPQDRNPYAYTNHEIAAYKIAQELGIGRVPPTVSLTIPAEVIQNKNIGRGSCLKVFNARKAAGLPVTGSIQYFITSSINIPYNPYYNKSSELKLFDYAIFNCDRPGSKNIIFREREPFYIDNGMSFLDEDKLKGIRSDPEFNNFCQDNLNLEKSPKQVCSLVNDQILRRLTKLQKNLPSITKDLLTKNRLARTLKRVGDIITTCSPKVVKVATPLQAIDGPKKEVVAKEKDAPKVVPQSKSSINFKICVGKKGPIGNLSQLLNKLVKIEDK